MEAGGHELIVLSKGIQEERSSHKLAIKYLRSPYYAPGTMLSTGRQQSGKQVRSLLGEVGRCREKRILNNCKDAKYFKGRIQDGPWR